MKRTVVGGLAASILIIVLPFSAADAADMLVKAPPPIPYYNWAGPSVGMAGGYGWGHSNQTDPGIPCSYFGLVGPINNCQRPVVADGVADGSYSLSGGIIGGGLGYNWQTGRWVYGIEADYSWANITGSSNTCGAASPVPHSCGTDLQSLGTLRGLFGYAVGASGNWLPYVTGGLAVGEVHAWDSLFPSSGSDFRSGWTVGAGLATGLTQNWIFQVEYLYVDLGRSQMFNVVPGVPETVSVSANVIEAGIYYKFY